MAFSLIKEDSILYVFPEKTPRPRNNDHLAHDTDENILKNLRQGGVYSGPYSDLAEADSHFVGSEAYVILVALFKKKNAKCITFADLMRTHGHGGFRKACAMRGPELTHQPHSKSTPQSWKGTHPLPRSLDPHFFLMLTTTPPAQKLTRQHSASPLLPLFLSYSILLLCATTRHSYRNDSAR